MDYTTQPALFKIRKALRYVSLYGVRRTWQKVQGQYHMKRRFDPLPELKPAADSEKHVGVIGCGNFAYGQIGYYLTRNFGRVIRGGMDVDIHRAASFGRRFGLDYYTDEAQRILDDEQIDLVYVASNHASHAEYAIEALRRGKSVHIEKPHVVNRDQLERLCDAMTRSKGKVRLGFNRPYSRIGVEAKRRLDAQPGAAMFNWFVAGHDIEPDHWYFSEAEGGRILGNLCHWTDFVFQLVPPEERYPIRITPTRSEKSDCDIAVTFLFGRGTIACLTFSAKGHAFDGVKERFSAHKGKLLLLIEDFQCMKIDEVERRSVIRNRFRDHGHEAAIRASYELRRGGRRDEFALPVQYVWETADLFLATKTACEQNEPVVIHGYTPVAGAAASRSAA